MEGRAWIWRGFGLLELVGRECEQRCRDHLVWEGVQRQAPRDGEALHRCLHVAPEDE